MSVKSENNKRIAKNTFLLYFRMLFTMGVSLYTSRVVLNTLGVEDFGIYNVVGGVVVMFSFLNSSLATATQRFLNYEMGQGNALKLEKVFSIALTGHYLIALSVILLAETIGLWFVSTQLEIPAERMHAALWVYQFSILTLAVSIISVPYNAVIIAHERMKVFAYVSIAEVSLKLTVVFLLVYLSFDKLVLYAFLLLVVAVIVRMIYATYCKRNFTECKYRFIFEKDLFAQMFCFSGWMFTGTLSNLFSSQGVNILINMFFGPIQNAARGIAYQIQGTVNAFVTNFMVAVQPQIVKSYSQGNYSYMYKLVFMASRYSFYLLFLLSLPVLLQTVSIATLAEKRARLLRAVHATGRYRPVDQLFVHPDCFGSLRIRENTQLPARRFRRLPAHFRIDPAVLPTRIPVLRSLRRSDNHILHRIVRPFVRIETFRPFSFEKIYP